MPSPLVSAHIEAQRRLRVLTATAVGTVWERLGSYDEKDVAPFLAVVVPIVQAAQRQSVALTEAFLARSLTRPPKGIDPSAVAGAEVRNGTAPEEVYRRPFVTVWAALGNGVAWEDAVKAGGSRATSAAETDVQLAMRATLRAVALA